jgi:hypothetical protein
MAVRAEGFNSDEFKLVGPHEKHAVATWNWESISVFAKRPENLRRDDRSQELPDAYWLLTRSPANQRIWDIP